MSQNKTKLFVFGRVLSREWRNTSEEISLNWSMCREGGFSSSMDVWTFVDHPREWTTRNNNNHKGEREIEKLRWKHMFCLHADWFYEWSSWYLTINDDEYRCQYITNTPTIANLTMRFQCLDQWNRKRLVKVRFRQILVLRHCLTGRNLSSKR